MLDRKFKEEACNINIKTSDIKKSDIKIGHQKITHQT
jgi:hypothetical protein